ncbi:MAG: 50S ribosomal protein L25/general stress protein Ctc [Betaproteobacteria bacterium]|nr:50S ribosomal protein L25/general stress protein Ctc [Betaproteobacteria bacterium]MBI3938147.1 50S ribosomal protein L25/general stress protein Ctc [Betaproteobacteria bacterium]
MEVTAFPRSEQGTGASRRLRSSGRVPGIIYGADQPAQPIEVDHHALLRHLKLETFHASILEMTVDGQKERVLLRDFQMHPWKQQVLHVDFQRVDPRRKIHMSVPLHFMNAEICPGVKLGGGVVNHVMNEINIQCLPDDLPEFIEVDLVDLQLGHSVHVADLKMPKGVEPVSKLRHENPAVATVQVPKAIVIEEEVAAPVTEIIGEVPAAEEGAPAAAEAEKKEEKAEKAERAEKGEKKEGGKKE